MRLIRIPKTPAAAGQPGQRGGSDGDSPEEAPRPPAQPRLRRRPAYVAAGALLVVVGAFVSYMVVANLKDTTSVVVAVRTIPRGQTIAREDLTVSEVKQDSLVAGHTVPAAGLDGLVGRRAATDIPGGVPVAGGSVTSDLLPAAGQAVVGILLRPGVNMPATPPRMGQPITLVSTPAQNQAAAQPGGGAAPAATWRATVVQFTTAGDGAVVDVTVPADQAAAVARLVAGGQIAAFWDSEP